MYIYHDCFFSPFPRPPTKANRELRLCKRYTFFSSEREREKKRRTENGRKNFTPLQCWCSWPQPREEEEEERRRTNPSTKKPITRERPNCERRTQDPIGRGILQSSACLLFSTSFSCFRRTVSENRNSRRRTAAEVADLSVLQKEQKKTGASASEVASAAEYSARRPVTFPGRSKRSRR